MRISRDQDGKGHEEKALLEPGLVNRGESIFYPGVGQQELGEAPQASLEGTTETNLEYRGVLRNHWEI